jgi:hypothetical protein
MKHFIISIFLLVSLGINSWSQDLLGFENITGNDRKDFKNAEPKALEAACLLLKTPVDAPKSERIKALNYMLMWMEGTPDYVFYVDENIGIFTHSSKALLEIYMAALTKCSLENPETAKDRKELKFKSIEIYLDYCLNPANHVKSFKQLEKLAKAREKGQLEEYIEE